MAREAAERSPLNFVLLVVGYAGLAPLVIWSVLSFPNLVAMALAVPFAALLAWAGWRLVEE